MPDVRETVTKLYDAWANNDPEALEALLTDDYVDHDPMQGFPADKAGAKQVLAAIMGATKDVEMKVGGIIVDGDNAAGRWTMEWTQVGDFMGQIPADGKRVSMRGHDAFKLRDGRIAETWHVEDVFSVLAQLGVIPAS